MIKGMTGFGCARFVSGETEGFIEVKSVNHRYLDISFYLPFGFASYEDKFRELLRKKVERGRIVVSFKITKKPVIAVGFKEDVAKTYIRQSARLKKKLHLKGDLSLKDLIGLPGVVETHEAQLNNQKLWPVVRKGFDRALGGLDAMRAREGKSLVRDIDKQLKRILLRIKGIKKRAKSLSTSKKKILNDDEYLSYQKGIDINEEIARLIHHTEELKKLLKINGSIGKRLDFIAQEMQRETNTIGSKMQDRMVANAVISIKTKIEKIREQAQNIE